MGIKQMLLIFGLAIWLVALWIGMFFSTTRPVYMVLLAWLASPLLLGFLRVTLELPFLRNASLYNPRTQSWSFLFGDTLWLPLALAAGAIAYRHVPSDSRFQSGWYFAVCLGAGVIAGLAFHYLKVLDMGAYQAADWAEAMHSPTKLAHDFVAYPFLFSALLYVALPSLWYNFKWAGAVALLGMLLWLGCVVADAKRAPRPQDMHPRWDIHTFNVIQ